MTKFRTDNTDGYTDAQLVKLNQRYDAELAACESAAQEENSVQDHIAERVLAEFDAAQ